MHKKTTEYITRGDRNKGIQYLNKLVEEGEKILDVKFEGDGENGKIVIIMEDQIK